MAEPNQAQTPYFYMLIMLITGACNTLLMKFLVMQVASPAAGVAARPFDYPFFQTMLMMLGELMCLGAYFHTNGVNTKQENANFPMWIMAIPVTCDWTATTLVNAAYVILPASTIQMCRGCIVIFTCLFSVIFLGRRQQAFHYVGVALVALGITIVSLQALFEPSGPGPMKPNVAPWIGIALVLGAQLFQSTMLVVEEKYLGKYSVPPLQMVGLEGLFGSIFGVFILFTLQQTGVESSTEALYMMQSSKAVQFGCIASMFSIAFFNWSGVTVTQTASCVARSTIDVSRTALIWAVELFMLWNTFSWLQLVGFVVLIAGTLIYNELVTLPFLKKDEQERRSILEDKDCHA